MISPTPDLISESMGTAGTDTPPHTTVTDPRTGRPRAEWPVAGAAEVTAAVARAQAAAESWAALTVAQRSRRLLDLARRVRDDAERYVAAEQAGTGMPRDTARAEVEQTADVLEFYAGAARAETGPAGGSRIPGRESWVRWEPLGVVAAIVPWNYPLMMAAWRIGPALAAGNAVILKPAETTPDTAELLARDACETLGPDVLCSLPGDRGTGQLLVQAPVDAIAFTGSNTAGHHIAAAAGARRISLELGGNCPALVLPGAPAYTYEELAKASTYNAGQSCAAPARVITLRENYEETVELLREAMSSRSAGVHFGPLNNPSQAHRFDAIIASSSAGRQFVGDMDVPADLADGYWRPTRVLADLRPDDPAVLEEVFGPVLTVQAAEDLRTAVAMANDVPQALAASVWGRDIGQLISVSQQLNAGETWINCHLEQTAELPHGGRRQSGNGTDLSSLALSEYQRPKTVTVRTD